MWEGGNVLGPGLCDKGKGDTFKEQKIGSSLVVQWSGLCASPAEGLGSIPSWRTKNQDFTNCMVQPKK